VRYRVGVIGETGRGGYGHGLDLAFAGLPGVTTVAVADPDDAGRAAAVARTGADRGYADYREMLRREALDLVVVAPHWLAGRRERVLAAVAAGARGLLVEKPFAASLEDADAMLAAADERGVKIAVAHQNRAFPAPRRAGAALAGGKIGRLRAMRAWSKHDERGGGLELLIHGTHAFDLMRHFAGEARWCHARVTAAGREARAEDAAPAAYGGGPILGDDVVASYGFDGGVTGAFESMRSDDGGGSAYFRLELCGTAGVLTLWSSASRPDVAFYPRPFVLPDAAGDWQTLPGTPLAAPPGSPAGAGPMHPANHALATALLAAVEGRGAPLSSGRDGRAALEMILAAYASHLRGGRVALPLTDRAHPLAGAGVPEPSTAAERRA
jgi:predicted dehydrogenase